MSNIVIPGPISHLPDQLGIDSMEDDERATVSVRALRKALLEAYQEGQNNPMNDCSDEDEGDHELREDEETTVGMIMAMASFDGRKLIKNYRGSIDNGHLCYAIECYANDPIVDVDGCEVDNHPTDHDKKIVYWPDIGVSKKDTTFFLMK